MLAVLLLSASLAPAAAPPGLPVVVARPAEPITITPSDVFRGKAEPEQSATVLARVAGVVDSLLVKEGDSVKKGTLLARLDSRLLRAEADKAEALLARNQARLDAAKASLDRISRLRDARAVSEAEFQAARNAHAEAAADVAVARAGVAVARIKLEMAEARAPIDGVVAAVRVKAGEAVKANETALLVVESVGPAHVAIDVDEQSYLKTFLPARAVKGGLAVRVTCAEGKDHEGRVVSVGRIDPKTGTAPVRVGVAAGLTPGLSATVSLPKGKPYTLLISPATPRITPAGAQILTVADADGLIRHRTVKLDARGGPGHSIAVASGLSAGDRVLLDQYHNPRRRPPAEGTQVIVAAP